jgi:colanic acid/amylovoran biosynthesis glycosyltransferase
MASNESGQDELPPRGTPRSRSTCVAHVIPYFLQPSETFIYTQLQAQRALSQVVVARQTANRSWFPFDNVYASEPTSAYRKQERLVDAARRLAHRPTKYQKAIIDVAGRFQADVLHAHFGWSGVDAILPARELNIPLVTAFHGSDVYVRPPRDHISNRYAKLFSTGTIFTCVGPRAGAALIERGCPEDRLRTVPVGIDLSAFPYRRTPPEGPFTILQVSRLVAKKGVDLSLQAFAKARKLIDNAQLWIVGDGPERESLRALTTSLDLGRDVTFYGAVSSAQIQELMKNAHLGIQPSRIAPNGDREGTPTVLLEFQAVGVDVAATRHADIPSIVVYPDELVAEDDAEALATAMVRSASLDSAARDRRAQAGRSFIESRHDATKIAEQLLGVYLDAIALGLRT